MFYSILKIVLKHVKISSTDSAMAIDIGNYTYTVTVPKTTVAPSPSSRMPSPSSR